MCVCGDFRDLPCETGWDSHHELKGIHVVNLTSLTQWYMIFEKKFIFTFQVFPGWFRQIMRSCFFFIRNYCNHFLFSSDSSIFTTLYTKKNDSPTLGLNRLFLLATSFQKKYSNSLHQVLPSDLFGWFK